MDGPGIATFDQPETPSVQPPAPAPTPVPVVPVIQTPEPAPQPQPGKKMPIKYIAIGIVAIIIVAIGVLAFTGAGNNSTSSSSSTVLASTISGSNQTGPYLSRQQFEGLLNVPASLRQGAIFNAFFAQSNAAARAIAPLNRTNDILSPSILGNITQGWLVSYDVFYNASLKRSLGIGTGNSAISLNTTQLVLKSSDIGEFASYFGGQLNASSIPLGEIGGFHYISFQNVFNGTNTEVVEGYKDSYIIIATLIAPANITISSSGEIASAIGGAT